MLGLEAWARIMVIHSKGVESSGSTFPALARILAKTRGMDILHSLLTLQKFYTLHRSAARTEEPIMLSQN